MANMIAGKRDPQVLLAATLDVPNYALTVSYV